MQPSDISEASLGPNGMQPSTPAKLGFHPTRAWRMVAILAAMLLLSFVDRYALTVLVGPIKQDLQLTDTQIGLLLGTAFGVFYSTAGLPIGYLIDRYNRRNLLTAGVVIWSSMTVLSGFAQDFTTLFIGRMGVGLGEAVLTPAAYSLIKDSFPDHLRGKAYGFYLFGSSVGTGAALVVTTGLAGWLGGADLSMMPWFSALAVWQQVLVVIGGAGLPIAALGMLIREPMRSDTGNSNAATLSAVVQHASGNSRTYVPLFLLYAVWGLCIYSYGAWIPTAISRAWHVPIATIGSQYGYMTMCLAPLAALMFSRIFDRLAKAGLSNRVALLSGLACLAVAIPTGIGPLAISPALTWICLGINIFFAMGVQLALALIIANVTPGRMIGKLSACSFLFLNVVGLGVGPISIPFVAKQINAGEGAIGLALGPVASAGWLVAGGLFLLVWRGTRRRTGMR